MSSLLDKLPTIPQYYKQYVDPNVDLETQSSQPCPFHNERSGKSFSFSKQLNIWRCFGQCHCGGDVIDLHRLNYRLKSRDEAKRSLYKMYSISIEETLSFERVEVVINEQDVYKRRVYALAVELAKKAGPEDWLELDYILSKVPYDVKELEVFCMRLGHPISSSNTSPN